jgi:hypothetical protein
MLERFGRHHDYVSSRRQRRIADLALLMNAGIAVLYLWAVNHWNWHLDVSAGAEIATLGFWAAALIGMLAASSVPGAIPGFFNDIAETDGRVIEPHWLRNARKYVFYPAAYANFVAAAIWIEVSGGLVDSPFTPVLLAMILTAQQLSRFKLNSFLFLTFGAAATGALAVYESKAGILDVPPPPVMLTFWILVISFLVTALCAHALKQRNYRASKTYPSPSDIEVYRDSAGSWRYAMYCRRTPLDPVLSESITTADDARVATLELVRGLCGNAQATVEWDTNRPTEEPAGRVVIPTPR